MSRRKLLRRVRRQQALAEQQQPSWTWRFSCTPTCLLFIGNGGIKSGVSQQFLLALLGSEEPTSLYLSAESGFAIARFSGWLPCQCVSMALNGCCVQEEAQRRAVSHLVTPALLSGPPLHLFLSYLECPPSPEVQQGLSACGQAVAATLPPGCHLLGDFVTREEERTLLDCFNTPTDHSSEMATAECECSEMEKVPSGDTSVTACTEQQLHNCATISSGKYHTITILWCDQFLPVWLKYMKQFLFLWNYQQNLKTT